MTTFNWSIQSMPAYPQEAGQTDVVFQVNWRCSANDNGYSANSYGSVPVTYTAGSPFTLYADLTQDQVWGWINPSIDRPEIETNLQTLIDAQKNPTVVTPPLPWSN
jgi:hypothetical protein